jgi:RND family efflux transporter MFP subunit
VLFLGSSFACWSPVAWSHEGHAPLPTRGVQVDPAQGLITLSPEAHDALGVRTSAVEERAMDDTVLAYAKLVTPWQRQFYVSSPVSGRIAVLHAMAGQIVKAGQLLAEIHSPELETLRRELLDATNDLDLASRQVERLRGLVEGQAVRERDLIEATTRRDQSQSSVRIARAKLRALGISDETLDELIRQRHATQPLLMPLSSPFEGSVSHADLAIGKVLAANEHLFEINDLRTLWVKIGVLERDCLRVHEGQRVDLVLSSHTGQVVSTRVSIPPSELDATTHVATAWAEIQNPEDAAVYLPGMVGTARIVVSEPGNRLTVPASALLGTGAEQYVLVEVAATAKGYEYRRQPVEVLGRQEEFVQIRSSGVFPGDSVVQVGGQELSTFFILGALRLSEEGIRNAGLRVEPATMREVEEVLELEGTIDLRPGSVATISSPWPGTLAKLLVDPGQSVVAGQVVAEVASLPLLDTQLAMIRAHLDVQRLEAMLQRFEAVGRSSAVPVRLVQESEAARDAAMNQREAARQTLRTLGFSDDDIQGVLASGEPRLGVPVRSPLSGVVVEFAKVLGEGLTADEPLLEVHDSSQPRAKAYLTEADVPRVPVGTPVRVRLVADPTFLVAGRITRSARMLDPVSRTLAVWIDFTEPLQRPLYRNLLARITATLGAPASPGSTATLGAPASPGSTVTLGAPASPGSIPSPPTSRRSPVLAVPRSAIVRENSRAYVFVQREERLLHRQHVELGRADDRYVEVRSGLQEGDRVAVQGAEELQTTYASVR